MQEETILPKELRAIALTLSGENILLVKRQHWLVLAYKCFFIIPILLTSLILIFFLHLFLLKNMVLFILLLATIIIFFLSVFITIVIKWYYHFYIVTTYKILELSYTPLLSRDITEVLLDQVRCTEIDIHTHGILQELLDIGNIIMTFDRPTHQEEFILSNLHNPKKIVGILSKAFNATIDTYSKTQDRTLWYKPYKQKMFRFLPSLINRRSITLGV